MKIFQKTVDRYRKKVYYLIIENKQTTTKNKEDKGMRYEVMVAGTVAGTYNTREEAEARLDEVRNSFFAMVHPKDTMFIKEVKRES